MTTTLDIPDKLHLQLDAKTARTGARLKEVAMALLERWVKDDPTPAVPSPSAAQWLEQWVQLGATTCADLPASPTTRDFLQEGRLRRYN